ncbi:MAG: DUF1858 domain-containing protein [Mesorhizobium sp.]
MDPSDPPFSDDATMDEIMRRWPATIRVILQNGMLCVGCPIAPFHKISDAAREHGLTEDELRRELQAVAASSPERREPPTPLELALRRA